MAWVDAADMMYQTGLEQYSESVFLHIAYANFLSTYKKSAMVRDLRFMATCRWLTGCQSFNSTVLLLVMFGLYQVCSLYWHALVSYRLRWLHTWP